MKGIVCTLFVGICLLVFLRIQFYDNYIARTAPTSYLPSHQPALSSATPYPRIQNGGMEKKSTLLLDQFTLSVDTRPPQNESQIQVVILVMLDSHALWKRSIVEQSWGRQSTLPKHVKLLFVLGNGNTRRRGHNNIYSDAIVVDATDTYVGLSQKVLMALKYFERAFPTVPFVMKADVDTFVNVPHLLHVLDRIRGIDVMMGCCFFKNPVIRSTNSKWYVSFDQYKNSHYPMYLSGGGGYVLSHSVCRSIIAASEIIPLFHLEDVYITGFLAGKVSGITAVCHNKFHWDMYNGGREFITMHGIYNVNMAREKYAMVYRGPFSSSSERFMPQSQCPDVSQFHTNFTTYVVS